MSQGDGFTRDQGLPTPSEQQSQLKASISAKLETMCYDAILPYKSLRIRSAPPFRKYVNQAFFATFAKTQGEKNSANLKTQGLLGAKI